MSFLIRSPFKASDIRLALSSLRVRLMLLVLIVVLPVLGLTLYAHLEGRRRAAMEVQNNTLRMTRLAAGNLTQLTDGARQLLIALARFADTSNIDAARCSASLADVLELYPLYVNLGVVAADGNLLCSGAPLGHRNLADHAWFQRAIQARAFVVGEYQADHALGEATFNVSIPKASSPAPALDWQRCSGSSNVTEGEYGPRVPVDRAPPFISRWPKCAILLSTEER